MKKENNKPNVFKNQYQEIFTSMNEVFQVVKLIYDKNDNAIDYSFLQVNPAFEKLVNKRNSELIGKRAKDIFGIVEEHWIDTFNRVEKTGLPENYEDYGAEHEKYYNIKVWKVENGMVAAIYSDITEIKKAEEALKGSEKQLKKSIQMLDEAQQMAQIGSWEWNVLTNEVKWSNNMFILLGLIPGSIEPSYQLALDHVHKDDKERYEKTLSEVLDNKKNYYLENRIVKKDKTVVSVISRGKCFVDKKGNLLRMGGTVQEITTQKLIAMGEMASSIAHDFNNSLQAMMGNLEIIQMQSNLPDSAHERLNNLNSIIADVADRVQALQQFGNTKSYKNNPKPLDFNSIIAKSLNQLSPLWKDKIEEKGLEINILSEYGDIPKIDSNKGDLKSVIFNLIKNSIEAMPKGGDISIKTGLSPKGIFATFTDTGIGMTEETKLKIFQPFFTTKGHEQGRGLGMSGVYNIVKRYGGSIAVKSSELDKGTTIELIFPKSQQNTTENIDEIETKNNLIYNILWVDDDVIIRENAYEILKLLGHNCRIADGGENALKYLNQYHSDIVFTDIGMPKMNGWELSKAIKNKYGDTIKVVIVSGWDVDKSQRKEVNYDFAMQKPFTMKELEKVLTTI